MNLKRRKKLVVLISIVLSLMMASYLVLYALRANINLFYTPTQLLSKTLPANATVRLGGMVKKGSVKHEKTSLLVSFVLTDFDKTVTVQFKGVLPTLFREGQGIVARGQYKHGVFVAEEVLAKHDSNYMPPGLKRNKKKVA